ncbi:hypothetical protein MUK42_32909 [Musa troglodytarum]|uniref:Uncharacterized protein n=1 Tax=Musa troglodytarum TaxID=320322 RepID=A0A9E7JPJ6_9LILI|nr:hypothetical protein MUK42_32909 [Musa troglodytarum]
MAWLSRRILHQPSTDDVKDESRGRRNQKAKIEVLLGKTESLDESIAAAAEESGCGRW